MSRSSGSRTGPSPKISGEVFGKRGTVRLPRDRYMRYLDRLIRLEMQAGRHWSKRANWLKFCARCGQDISSSLRFVRYCFACLEFFSNVTSSHQMKPGRRKLIEIRLRRGTDIRESTDGDERKVER